MPFRAKSGDRAFLELEIENVAEQLPSPLRFAPFDDGDASRLYPRSSAGCFCLMVKSAT